MKPSYITLIKIKIKTFSINFAIAIISFVLAIIIVSFYLPEWNYPCFPVDDGPSPNMYGFPMPYIADSETSLHWYLMPHVLILNILLLSIPIYILLSVLIPSTWKSKKWLKWITSTFGIIFVAAYLILVFHVITTNWLGIKGNTAFNMYKNTGYINLRPVDTIFFRSSNCFNDRNSIENNE